LQASAKDRALAPAPQFQTPLAWHCPRFVASYEQKITFASISRKTIQTKATIASRYSQFIQSRTPNQRCHNLSAAYRPTLFFRTHDEKTDCKTPPIDKRLESERYAIQNSPIVRVFLKTREKTTLTQSKSGSSKRVRRHQSLPCSLPGSCAFIRSIQQHLPFARVVRTSPCGHTPYENLIELRAIYCQRCNDQPPSVGLIAWGRRDNLARLSPRRFFTSRTLIIRPEVKRR
jgi:hypothetical protein